MRGFLQFSKRRKFMKTRRLFFVLVAVMTILSVTLTACQQATEAPKPTEAATEVMTEAPTEAPVEAAIGSAEHPIKVLFVPSVDANQIATGGDIMAKALNKATGLEFVVTIPTSYAATIEEMCASPKDTMGFIPGLEVCPGKSALWCGCGIQSDPLR
ncbi:MAG: hypothetical protein MZV64_36020 [Ignavibacteriales bacterium]|nr:hypothetical protein [Ignavibacteriales bacterium]